MKRRLSTILMVLTLLLSISINCIPASATSVSDYSDVKPGDWFYDSVNFVTKYGLLHGYADGTFRPHATITYAEMAMIMARCNGLSTKPINNYWASGAISSCLNADDSGMFAEMKMKRMFDNEFKEVDPPAIVAGGAWDKPMTRAHAVSDIYEAECYGMSFRPAYPNDLLALRTNSPEYYKKFCTEVIPDWNDVVNTGLWDNIFSAYFEGWVSGVDSTHRFNPNGTITRAEVAKLLYGCGLISDRYGANEHLVNQAAEESAKQYEGNGGSSFLYDFLSSVPMN